MKLKIYFSIKITNKLNTNKKQTQRYINNFFFFSFKNNFILFYLLLFFLIISYTCDCII